VRPEILVRKGPLLRRVLCAALAALVFALVPSAHALPARDIAGVAIHPWRMESPQILEQTFSDLAAAGVRRARVDLRWLLIEPQGPALASGRADWREMDAIVAAAERHGVELLPVVAYVPHWANEERNWWAYPESRPFETFFAAALRRYPHISAWELWNEPNFGLFSKPRPDPARFVAFLRSANRARAQVGSQAKLISGGLAPGMEMDIVEWVDEMARLGGLELIDGLGIHPYSPVSPDDPRAWMMRLEALHDRLAYVGRPGLSLWLTEYGAPVSAAGSGWGPPLTEEEQAKRLRVAFALATRLPFVENLTWFEYRDSCREPSSADCHFGLVRDELSPRPALGALREVTAGATTRLRPRLTLHSRLTRPRRGPAARRHRGRRSWQRVTIAGRLLLPGSATLTGRLSLRVLRAGMAPRAMTVTVRDGAFRGHWRRHGRRRWTIEARYSGSRAYEPASVRVRMDVGGQRLVRRARK
jgi:polysaccharide biosynthesis protein PslG